MGVPARVDEPIRKASRDKPLKWVALATLPVTLLLSVGSVVWAVGDLFWVAPVLIAAWLLLLNTSGVVVIGREPRNPIGWLLIGSVLFIALGNVAQTYAQYVYQHGHPGLPLASTAAWISQWATIPGFTLFLFVFLRFPSGALLSQRWRFVEGLTLVGVVFGIIALALRPGPLESVPGIDNPLGIEGLGSVADFAEGLGSMLLTFLGLSTIVSLILRFRSSEGMERQQLKWFVYAVSLLPVFFTAGQIAGLYDKSEEEYSTFLIIIVGLLLIPIAMGIAILRYRLYDIDVVINRTLVYAGLTAALLGSYLLLVVTLSRVLDPITRDSDIAVAASTLAVAALFRPLRARIQGFIDRRFYRAKYDATRAVANFVARLRDEIEVETVRSDVLDVVSETVQPRHVSLWLRPENAS